MDDNKHRDAIGENESIAEGLENFLEKELGKDLGISGTQPEKKKTQPVKKQTQPEKKQTQSEKKQAQPVKKQSQPVKKQPQPAVYTAPAKRDYLQEDGYEEDYEEDESFDYEFNDDDDDEYVVRRRIYDEEEEYRPARAVRRSSPDRKKPSKKKETASHGRRKPKEVHRKTEVIKKKKRVKVPASADEKKQKRRKRWLGFLLFLVILLSAFYIMMNMLVGKAYRKMNYEQVDEELAQEPMMEEGVINILLIGNDSRQKGEDGRSDAMILVSVNRKAKSIYMTSFLRDMYVEIPGYGSNRLNAAYAYGGASLLCRTIKQNFDIEVNRYAIVNFQAFASLVDAVGGVDIDVTSEEVEWINAYLNEYNLLEGRDITTDYLDTSLSGVLHLNGPQALAYCRNRYIGSDFGRTERQRKVLSAIMKKVPAALATNAEGLMDGIFPYLTTNLTKQEVSRLSFSAGSVATFETKSLTIPADGTWQNANIDGKAVLQVDFEANKQLLQTEIYAENSTNEEGTDTAEQDAEQGN